MLIMLVKLGKTKQTSALFVWLSNVIMNAGIDS